MLSFLLEGGKKREIFSFLFVLCRKGICGKVRDTFVFYDRKKRALFESRGLSSALLIILHSKFLFSPADAIELYNKANLSGVKSEERNARRV